MSNTITSEEVNYLVFRYLLESGYTHTAFTFGHEALVLESDIDVDGVPPGALLGFLQRGVSYAEIEAHVARTHAERLKKGTERQENGAMLAETVSSADKKAHAQPGVVNLAEVHRALVNRPRRRQRPVAEVPALKPESGPSETMASEALHTVHDTQVTVLYGHTAEVFAISWSPTQEHLLASGSGDATARIWAIPSGPSGRTAVAPPLELRHQNLDDYRPLSSPTLSSATDDVAMDSASGAPVTSSGLRQRRAPSRDVTALDWSPDGRHIATASYDGASWIWTSSGTLERVLTIHIGPVLSLRWNSSGKRLATSSVDHSVAIWDMVSARLEQQVQIHRAPVLDVDWQSEDTFASSGSDKMIYVFRVGESKPLRIFYGHQDEVNSIKWDPTGTLLASGSDDCTVKIWRPIRQSGPAMAPGPKSPDNQSLGSTCDYLVHDYTDHTKEVYTVRWSPGANHYLASASFDATVRVWDPAQTGDASVMTLSRHFGPVFSVAFSPCGHYLASGSSDRNMLIWSLREGGKLIRVLRCQGGIFEVAWNATGSKVAAALSNGTVAITDLRM
jgi:transducin (beta)-like 1